MRLFFLLLLGSLAAAPQQVGQNAPKTATPQATFRVATQLVVQSVVVNDKNGNSIEGLTEKDFVITEDGVQQAIHVCEFQKLPEVPEAVPEPLPERPKPHTKLPRTQIAPEVPGSVRYSNKRLLVLYFDMTAMQEMEQMEALDAAKKFIRTQMTSADLVAIMMFTGGEVRVLEDFTGDRNQLLSTIETMLVGEADAYDYAGDPSLEGESEFNIFFTDRKLAALQTAAKMLEALSEKKSLIYFAGGLTLSGIDNNAQLRATINAAIRAGVSFWPVDARGLVAQAPLGDASKSSPGGVGMYSGSAARGVTSKLQRSQDTLWSIAADTGGKALLDSNELSAGIVQAQKSFTSYYILGYYTSNEAQDGKFRRVKVTLANGMAATLDYRQGYYAGKVFSKFTTADRERQLEEALRLGDPITELTMAMEIGYFQLNRNEYFVPLTVKIPGRELALARKGGFERTRIDFIGEVKDAYGTTIQNVRDFVDIKLTDATAAELAKRPIQYETGFTLLPDSYRVKILARDAETGRIGTFEMNFVVPNLNKEQQRIPISSVTLSSQLLDLREALYDATKAKDRERIHAANPLVQDGRKLIPSVTRVFRTDQDLYVYLQAYDRGQEGGLPLVAFVTFYQGQNKAFETPPMAVAGPPDPRSNAVPLRFAFSLSNLPPGEYECQVTVLSPGGQKASFWQAPIMLIR